MTAEGNIYMYILYLRYEDIILLILYTGLPITTTLAGIWLNNLTFHGEINFIRANGQKIIDFVQTIWEVLSHS